MFSFWLPGPPQGTPSVVEPLTKDDNTTSLIIAVVVTFVLTAILVAFIMSVAFWIHHAYKAKKEKAGTTDPGTLEAVAPNFIPLEKSVL